MRRELFDQHDRSWGTIGEAQAALDGWVDEYNTDRPHRSLGGRPPVERFALAGQRVDAVSNDDEGAAARGVETASPRPAGCRGGWTKPGRSGWPSSATGLGRRSPVGRSRSSSGPGWSRSCASESSWPRMCNTFQHETNAWRPATRLDGETDGGVDWLDRRREALTTHPIIGDRFEPLGDGLYRYEDEHGLRWRVTFDRKTADASGGQIGLLVWRHPAITNLALHRSE
jgi:Integrase core domain